MSGVQALLPVEDRLAVNAPSFPSDGFAWGVDVGKRRIAIGAGRPGKVYVDERHRGGAGEPEAASLIELEKLAFHFAMDLIDEYPPVAVAVEIPFAKHQPTKMGSYYGAVVLGIHHALSKAEHVADLWAVESTAWKKHVIGKGNAPKAQVREWAKAWTGAELASEDAADAVAICRWAIERFS